jgi:mono/diheme cytochrome c family protein
LSRAIQLIITDLRRTAIRTVAVHFLSHFLKVVLMMNPQRVLFLLLSFALAVFGLGCNLSSSTSSSNAPGGPNQGSAPPVFDSESGPHAPAKKAMVAAGCMRCHLVNGARVGGWPPMGGPPGGGPGGPPGLGGPGPGGPGGGRAPDLGKVGSDPEHTVDWFIKYVRDPKSIKPNSRMPPQNETTIRDSDLRAVAEYLASLK